MDRVQVLKRESVAGGGDAADEAPWDAPIEPQEDAVEAAGVYLQDASNRDESTLIARAGDDMTFKDVNNPTAKTLTDLLASAGGGITEGQHEVLDTLVHDTLGEAHYLELSYSGFQVTDAIWWTDSGKTKKLRETNLTYTGFRVTGAVLKVYDGSGSEITAKRQNWTLVYTGFNLNSVTVTLGP